ncbi:MAG: hypothetical protein JW716_01770 [Candidatus Aenigmarchaeota archaeon]|nr:hypothetical protein [Candidatus Aenigmarchaeota archaeon]
MDIKFFLCFFFVFALLINSSNALICGIYFTDSNSPECQLIDDYISEQTDLPADLTLIIYDLADSVNANIGNDFLNQYFLSESYSFPVNAPFILFSEDHHLAGIDEIKECLSLKMKTFMEYGGNPCPVLVYPPDNDPSGDGGSGTPPTDSGDIPGNPEIRVIETENPKDVDTYTESTTSSGKSVNEEEIKSSEDAINKKIREAGIEELEKSFIEQLPYIYIVILAVVVFVAFVIYIKKSK